MHLSNHCKVPSPHPSLLEEVSESEGQGFCMQPAPFMCGDGSAGCRYALQDPLDLTESGRNIGDFSP